MRQQPFASPQEALEHYGTKGMKWGVRNERKNSSQKSGVGVDPLTAAIGAAYVAVALASVYKIARERKVLRDDSGVEIQKRNAKVPWKTNPELSKKMSIEDLYDKVVVPVNPKYGAPGTKMNCRRATMAYEMRRRGLDVEATKSILASGQDLQGLKSAVEIKKAKSRWGEKAVLSAPELANLSHVQRSSAIFNHLDQHPEGARGELAVGWKWGGGHSMAWEKVNGKPIIFDAQSKHTFRDAEAFTNKARGVHEAGYTRTDNAKLNEDFLRRWVTNV